MREKELRIALVCFGGVSLAVYMHGISKEVLKLVRASSALHAIADRSLRATGRTASGFSRRWRQRATNRPGSTPPPPWSRRPYSDVLHRS